MIQIKKNILKHILKSLGNKTYSETEIKEFNELKRKVLEALKEFDEQDKKQVQKALNEEDESIVKKSALLGIEKALKQVGEISTYKDGSKWKKIQMNPPKWRCIKQGREYNTENKGSKIAIKALIKKVQNCQNVDDLCDIVFHNISRFRDSEGKILPIVEQVKNAVNEKKTGLNAGKPTTKEQIDKWNKEHAPKEKKTTTKKTTSKTKTTKTPAKKQTSKTKEKKAESPKTTKLTIPEGIDGIATKDSKGITEISNIKEFTGNEVCHQYLNNDEINGTKLTVDPNQWSDKIASLGKHIFSMQKYLETGDVSDSYKEMLKENKSDLEKLVKLKNDFDNLPKNEKVKLLENNIKTLKNNKMKLAPYFEKNGFDTWVTHSLEGYYDKKIKSMESMLTRVKKGQVLENTIKTDGVVDRDGNYIRCRFGARNGKISISARDYDHLPRSLQSDTDFIRNDSDHYTDYFDNDSITITPSNPYYNDAVKAAFQHRYKKDIAAYKKATENNKKFVKNGGELEEEKQIEPLSESARKTLEENFKEVDGWIKSIKPGHYSPYLQPPRLRMAISRMTDEQKREVYIHAIKKFSGALGAYGRIKKDAGFNQEQLDKFLDEKLGENFGKKEKTVDTKESKIAKISSAPIITLKKLKSDFIDFEKSSGIDKNLVESLFNGTYTEKKESTTETEKWESPNPQYEKNLGLFDDEQIKELSETEKDETRLKIINHVMKERGIQKSFSSRINDILKKLA